MTRFSTSTLKLICIVLILCSLISTFFGWISLSKENKDIIKGIDASSVLSGLVGSYGSFDDSSLSQFEKTFSKISDGSFSLSDINYSAKIVKKINTLMNNTLLGSFGDSEVTSKINSVCSWISFGTFVMIMLQLVACVLFLITCLKKSLKYSFVAATVFFVSLIGSIITVLSINGSANEIVFLVGGGIIWGFICSVAAYLIWKTTYARMLSEGDAVEQPLEKIDFSNMGTMLDGAKAQMVKVTQSIKDSVPLATSSSWNCKSCKCVNLSKNAFCVSCGAKRPEPKRCSGCNTLINEDSMFCGKCGTKYVAPIVCSQCGEIAKDGVFFCRSCGNKVR